jgi:intracellular septation protein
VLNEVVRLTFKDAEIYSVLGFEMDGVNIWILFKIAFIMPLSGLYAWYLTRLMQKHRIDPDQTGTVPVGHTIDARKAGQGPGFAPVERRAAAPSR